MRRLRLVRCRERHRAQWAVTSVVVGGSVSLESGAAGSATFGDGLSVSGGSVVVESGDRLVGVGGEVEVTGSESVRVGSMGAIVELAGASDSLEYVGFVWRSSASFDGYAVGLPSPITDVVEVIARSIQFEPPRVVSRAGRQCGFLSCRVCQDLGRVCGRRRSREGSHSLDGLHVAFEQQDVAGVSGRSRSLGRLSRVGANAALRSGGWLGCSACFGIECA